MMEETANQEEHLLQERKAHFLKKLKPYEGRLREWSIQNPNIPPPIHVDEKGEVHWLNREMRRKFKK